MRERSSTRSFTASRAKPRKWMGRRQRGLSPVRSKNLYAPAEPADPRRLVHLANCYDEDGTIRVYRDGVAYGVPDRPEKAARTYPAETSEILIGLRHAGAGNGFFAGEIEEARVYDRALTAKEMAASFRIPAWIDTASSLDSVLAELTPDERLRYDSAMIDRAKARDELAALPPPPKVYAAISSEAGVTHVLGRGDVEQKGKPDRGRASGSRHVRKPRPRPRRCSRSSRRRSQAEARRLDRRSRQPADLPRDGQPRLALPLWNRLGGHPQRPRGERRPAVPPRAA